jgi:hypothetical protein
VDPVDRPQDGDQTFLSVNCLLHSRGKFTLRFCPGGFIWIMLKERQLIAGDHMLETVFLLQTQDVQKLVGKCNTISLLGGIKSVRDSSEMKLLQSQVFLDNSQACDVGNSEVSSKKLTRRKRAFF